MLFQTYSSREMEHCEEVILLVDGKNQMPCPESFVQKSEVLTNMCRYSKRSRDPIPIPLFITQLILIDLFKLTESKSLQNISNSGVEYMIQLTKASDFLDIQDITRNLLQLIHEKLTIENCFEIFKLTNSILCLRDITSTSLQLMRTILMQFYESKPLSENNEDPYIDHYQNMHVSEIQNILGEKMKYSTIASIMVIRNWWKKNTDVTVKDEIFLILKEINENASYIPRSKIIFMRMIRDKIIADINLLMNSTKNDHL